MQMRARDRLVCLFEHGQVISKSLDSMPCVHKIKMIDGINPGCFSIIDQEFDVWRYPRRLDGTQVNTLDKRTRILLAHCRKLDKLILKFR